jgi:8-oxo-dGTP pyrophosphatase MutT (NUDIX family)
VRKNLEVTVRGRRLVCENSRWKVYFEHLEDAAGAEVPDYMVVETHAGGGRPVPTTGVCVLPRVGDAFGLLTVYRRAACGTVWEAPRGFIDPRESPREAALRELTEETGLRCDPADLVPLGTFMPEAGMLAARVALFVANDCRAAADAESDELGLGELTLIPEARLRRMLAASEIQDAATQLAYLRYCEFHPGRPDGDR